MSIIWQRTNVWLDVDSLTRQALIDRARQASTEVDAVDAAQLLSTGAIAVDVRETEEIAEGLLKDAVVIPRGFLELRIEGKVPNRNQPLVVYCASGVRSLLATWTLRQMGYPKAVSLTGGFDGWKTAGLPWVVPQQLTSEQKTRYRRHLLLPGVGEEGQQKLLSARVLLIGAGGLGSPVAMYLAAAGVGHIGIIDPDTIDRSNLQRQILHQDADTGLPKVDSAERAIQALNPDVRVIKYPEAFDASTAERILDEGWDVVVDGCDNFTTRYLINDACVRRALPNVHGSIYQFEGQVGVFSASPEAPCYRCLYPAPPPPEMAPNCAEAGVLGVLPGVIGTTQALETLKILLNLGSPLVGRLGQFDALTSTWRNLKIRKDPNCAECSPKSDSQSVA